MGIADSMKNITEGIITSYDMRVGALNSLVADTRKTLKEFRLDRKKMSKELSSGLAAFKSNLEKGVGAMIKEFHKNHKGMSDEQTKDLAKFMKNLATNVGSMLDGFQESRSEMSDDLRKRLETAVKETRSYTKKMLKEFSDNHTVMSEELREFLSKFSSDVQKQVEKLLGEYEADMKKAANAWHGMSMTLAKARAGEVAVSTDVKARPVEEAIEEAEGEVIKEGGKKKKDEKRNSLANIRI